jgi:hypothetical protein
MATMTLALTIFLVAAASVGEAGGTADAPTTFGTFVVTPAGALTTTCEVECRQGGDDCGDTCRHVAPPGDTHELGAGGHTWCFEGYCEMGSGGGCERKHDSCTGIGEASAVIELLDAGDYSQVYELTQGGGPMRLVWAEAMIAIDKCNGRVAATVALNPVELAALALADAN